MNNSVLFISYDGLLDPLGGSQILPYLYSIRQHPRPLYILSYEKPERFKAGGELLKAELASSGIGWTPLSFTTRFGRLGKLWDLSRMYEVALYLQLKHRFGVIHCRSYQAMQVGALLRKLTGVKVLFDMRGLWVNERVDGDIWKLDNSIDASIFKLYKRVERSLLLNASHIVALTERVVPELYKLSPDMSAPISVIPCCADFEHFSLPTAEQRILTRKELGLPENAFVLSYLGSLGTWYMLDEMLQLFGQAATEREDVHFLLITKDWRAEHESLISALGLSHLRTRIHVHEATRDQVPSYIGCSDLMLSFIKPAYSKIASSPTKMAEALAVGVPVVSNAGIGDIDTMTARLKAGAVINLDEPDSLSDIVSSLDSLKKMGGHNLRARAKAELDLHVAELSYKKVYEQLEHSL
ncbi:glycosyltransferase [Psychrobacter sp. DAB_AL62B]|uniref:glycosyltransferase n=1 Tax=Psychrobacter sp. DAB_AL62B TaxID=1028420 RepID=UPI002380EB9E|nr:glycosyltransferase [Psychrobacter sp. DAB_AL62B]MDE4455112.1 glycosyltransferase [Psychrobacter sp. DAB_AL62B]